MFQSLFYWITYSYIGGLYFNDNLLRDVSILILLDYLFLSCNPYGETNPYFPGFNPYFIGLPILILCILTKLKELIGFNPYFIGLPILMD